MQRIISSLSIVLVIILIIVYPNHIEKTIVGHADFFVCAALAIVILFGEFLAIMIIRIPTYKDFFVLFATFLYVVGYPFYRVVGF
jgi:hypothetical protein